MDLAKSEFTIALNELTPEILLDFDVENSMTAFLKEKSPLLWKLLVSSSHTSRSLAENTVKTPDLRCSIIASQICNSRSKYSIYFQLNFAFVLYSCGISRRSIDLLSKCGLCVSYTSLSDSLKAVSNAMMKRASDDALGVHAISWDNYQSKKSIHAEQYYSAASKVELGTSIIRYPLRWVSPNICSLRPILERQAKGELITYKEHIRPTIPQLAAIDEHLRLDLIHILIGSHAKFRPYADHYKLKHKRHRKVPPSLGIETQALQATTADESTTIGQINVLQDIYVRQLGVNPDDMEDLAIPCINDQATNARIRAAQAMRSADTNSFNKVANFQLGMGLFHTQMNDSWALLGIHRGSLKDPGSLQYAADLLHHSRVGSDRPDYYTLTSLFDKVLKANILTCWRLECGFDTLEAFAASNPSDDDLIQKAGFILDKYASDEGLQTYAHEGDPDKEDSLLCNTILLNRDLLLLHELDNAISAGDFGRVENMIGPILFTFCGAGCTNYTGELLHLVQNLNIVWPPEFADVMRDVMLISPSGDEEIFMGMDMHMEHHNKIQQIWISSNFALRMVSTAIHGNASV
ncbi:hypothetical protein SCHPADRAFT_897121 [Schizopora paradoxa]|uniref:DUF6589 domain-containing protein n=1 Tax=Schizopora paradoxa TaxID=27342 RepID=A0A0H2QZB8_9AGAM|nr:hypothetical protein SCHPADRAFT_897121 [Schizopora paradoxa]